MIMESVPPSGRGCAFGSWRGSFPVLAAAATPQVQPCGLECRQVGRWLQRGVKPYHGLQHSHKTGTGSSISLERGLRCVAAALVCTASANCNNQHRCSRRLLRRLHLCCRNADTEAMVVDPNAAGHIVDGTTEEELQELEDEGEEEEEEAEISERDLRWLDQSLRVKNRRQLVSLCQEIRKPAPPKASQRRMLEHLLSPSVSATAFAFLKAAKATTPALSPLAYNTVLATMAKGDSQKHIMSFEALRETKNAVEHVQSQPWLNIVDAGERSRSVDGGSVDDQFPKFFELAHQSEHDAVDPRNSLESLQVGDEITGRITGLSLYDGLRVDVGAEFDAWVPASFAEDEQVVKVVAASFPFGTEVSLRLLEVHKGQGTSALRFPLVAELLDSRWPFKDKEGSSGKPLFVDSDTDLEMLHESRGNETPAPDMGAASSAVGDEAQSPVGFSGVPWEAVRSLPTRTPQEDVLTFGTDDDVQLVEVPQEHRHDIVEPEKAAADAWGQLALDELSLVGHELSCRDRLAADLDTIEMDLAAGRPPSIPTSLLGMAPAGPLRQCLPLIDEDNLSFHFLEYDSKEQLLQWVEGIEREHDSIWQSWQLGMPDTKAVQQEREQLQRIFQCAEVCHVRAIYRVGALELKRYQLGKLQ